MEATQNAPFTLEPNHETNPWLEQYEQQLVNTASDELTAVNALFLLNTATDELQTMVEPS
jgi:hypothetical protein